MNPNFRLVIAAVVFSLCFGHAGFTQKAIDFMQIQGNSKALFLRIIAESDAITAGNGVLKIQLPDGVTGAADLVPTTHPDASEIRIQTPYGTRSWKKEGVYAKAYGGSSQERLYGITQSTDGGLVMVGYTDSWGYGSTDFFFLKTEENGNLDWAYAMGFPELGGGYDILCTSSGGYFLTGYYRDASYNMYGYNYHTNASGGVIFSGVYGIASSSSQRNMGAVQAADGNFVTAGYARNGTNQEIFLNKIDQWTGTSIWSSLIGTTYTDGADNIIQRTDGGYAVIGHTYTGSIAYDVCLLFVDAGGNQESFLAIGGSSNDFGNDIVLSQDGNYVFAGETNSYGTGGDMFLSKRDSNGDEIWSVAIGGASSDVANAVVQAEDGGYLLSGYTRSYGDPYGDLFLVKTDNTGNPEWGWTFGGSYSDEGTDIFLDENGCIYVCGFTRSYGVSTTTYDGLLVKFAPDGSTCLGTEVLGMDRSKNQPDNFHYEKLQHIQSHNITIPSVKINTISQERIKQATEKGTVRKGEMSISPTVTTICID